MTSTALPEMTKWQAISRNQEPPSISGGECQIEAQHILSFSLLRTRYSPLFQKRCPAHLPTAPSVLVLVAAHCPLQRSRNDCLPADRVCWRNEFPHRGRGSLSRYTRQGRKVPRLEPESWYDFRSLLQAENHLKESRPPLHSNGHE